MKIKLENNFFIEDDGSSYTVYQLNGFITDKNGKQIPSKSVVKYPGTFEQAVRTYARLNNLEYDGDLSGYVESINKSIEYALKLGRDNVT